MVGDGGQEVTITRKTTPLSCPKYSAVPTPGVFYVSIPLPTFVQRTKRSTRSAPLKPKAVAQPTIAPEDTVEAMQMDPTSMELAQSEEQPVLLEIPIPGFVPRTAKARANSRLSEVRGGVVPSRTGRVGVGEKRFTTARKSPWCTRSDVSYSCRDCGERSLRPGLRTEPDG